MVSKCMCIVRHPAWLATFFYSSAFLEANLSIPLPRNFQISVAIALSTFLSDLKLLDEVL